MASRGTKAPEEAEDREGSGIEWLSTALSKEESIKRWPHRQLGDAVPDSYDPSMPIEYLAKDHYDTVRYDDLVVRLGDCVSVHAEDSESLESEVFLMRVVELFEDVEGSMLFAGHYFYLASETCMASLKGAANNTDDQMHTIEVDQDMRRVFLATDADNDTHQNVLGITTMNEVVRIQWVAPGSDPPPASVCDYWYDQHHSRQFMTFRDIDVAPDWEAHAAPPLQASSSTPAPGSGAAAPDVTSSGAAAGEPAVDVPWYDTIGARWHFGSKAQSRATAAGETLNDPVMVYKVLELCAGGGGLSFLCQEGVVDGVHLRFEPRWAVDINEDACATYSVNHPHTHVHCTGIDEFKMMCTMFEELCQRYPQHRARQDPQPQQDAQVELIDMRIGDSAARGKGRQLLGKLAGDKCWLEFRPLISVDGHKAVGEWVALDKLPAGSEEAVGRLVDTWRAVGRLPRPGEVDVIAGGPPCQGVSGLNRHKSTLNILDDPKNRLIKTYFDYVEQFKPRWVLTEQVLDILQNEDGRYARFVLASLTKHRFQCRAGVIAAGEHGVPQGRYRVIFWGARQGMTLPSLPEPSHQVLNFNRGLAKKMKACLVQRVSDDAARVALPMVLLGDVVGHEGQPSDLPEVHNFCMTDTAAYTCEPQNPFQQCIRLAPPPGTLSVERRAQRADVIMGPAQHSWRSRVKLVATKQGLAAVGRLVMTKMSSITTSTKFSAETWRSHLKELVRGVRGAQEKAALLASMEATRAGDVEAFAEETGRLVMREIKAAEAAEAEAAARQALGSGGNGGTGTSAGDAGGGGGGSGGSVGTLLLRDHRPLMCNAHDYQRMRAVPSSEGASFRDMEGVVQNPDGTACTGCCHIKQEERAKDAPRGCAGGGKMMVKRKTGSAKQASVLDYDSVEGGAWRGSLLPGCPARTLFMPSGDLLVPRYCVLYKLGRSAGRHSCFGRCWPTEVQPTVVGRAEPHNLALIHWREDRVLSVRENARCQGFPDWFVFAAVGSSPMQRSGGVIESRYQQIGNAVAPPVASALGRCLLVAAATPMAWTIDRPVIPVPDPDMMEVYAECARRGQQLYSVVHGMVPGDGARGAGKRRRSEMDAAASDGGEEEEEEDEEQVEADEAGSAGDAEDGDGEEGVVVGEGALVEGSEGAEEQEAVEGEEEEVEDVDDEMGEEQEEEAEQGDGWEEEEEEGEEDGDEGMD